MRKIAKNGKFIVIEGIDACGKSSQIKRLASYLFTKDKRNHILITREPTMLSAEGKRVRELLAKQKDPIKNHELFTNLYVKDRKFHLNKIVVPFLRQGCIVISDRYKYSTFAYQIAQGEKLERLLKLHKGLLVPDIVIIIDITEEEAIRRLNKLKQKKDAFEMLDFLKKVRANYLKMKDIFPDERIIFVNGNRSEEEVFEEIKEKIDLYLKV
ncbi:MAG: dTMP kinase [Candidatus Micrarchaeota archaeon]|nr:dTMP kinase [Candidatus Micrarchaeota archaeon]